MTAEPHATVESKPHASEIKSVRPEGPLVDVMGGDLRREIRVLDHGLVALVDAMPRLVPEGQTGDSAIVQAARVSYGAGTKRVNEDRGLIRYLLRHRHTTPFEMVEFKFHCAMPIFVARQWIRHRTANVNEYSGRYSIMPDRFYRPDAENIRQQSTSNRQGGDGAADQTTADRFLALLERTERLHQEYLELTEQGLARELARIPLPQSLYTEWYWKIDLHNLLHFLSLRIDPHAQQEIRVYAQAMLDLIEPIVPVTVEAFRDYRMGAVNLTRLEVEAMRAGKAELDTENAREQREWQEKRERLGLS
ncbi:MAG: FAD-dependent thymidylate synthase [Phycisphaerales bacterium]